MTHKKTLQELTIAVMKHLSNIDMIMKEKESVDRGRKIAKCCNDLEIENDRALHFGLDLSFDKIGKMKQWTERVVEQKIK